MPEVNNKYKDLKLNFKMYLKFAFKTNISAKFLGYGLRLRFKTKIKCKIWFTFNNKV
jgi:hypothetical protein